MRDLQKPPARIVGVQPLILSRLRAVGQLLGKAAVGAPTPNPQLAALQKYAASLPPVTGQVVEPIRFGERQPDGTYLRDGRKMTLGEILASATPVACPPLTQMRLPDDWNKPAASAADKPASTGKTTSGLGEIFNPPQLPPPIPLPGGWNPGPIIGVNPPPPAGRNPWAVHAESGKVASYPSVGMVELDAYAANSDDHNDLTGVVTLWYHDGIYWRPVRHNLANVQADMHTGHGVVKLYIYSGDLNPGTYDLPVRFSNHGWDGSNETFVYDALDYLSTYGIALSVSSP